MEISSRENSHKRARVSTNIYDDRGSGEKVLLHVLLRRGNTKERANGTAESVWIGPTFFGIVVRSQRCLSIEFQVLGGWSWL